MMKFLRLFLPLILLTSGFAQDWIKTGTGLGVEKVRLAVPDFNRLLDRIRRTPNC